MRFDGEQQHRFDALIGRAALAQQEERFVEAFEHLKSAEALLTEHGITDAYDWSGYFDLRMCVEANHGDQQAAALTAQRMMNLIDPRPEGFSSHQQEVIQDSLVEASLLRARHLMKSLPAEVATELGPLIERAIQWCEWLGRDGDQREFEEMRVSLRNKESGTT